jgi:nickel-dependent lactate racemase
VFICGHFAFGLTMRVTVDFGRDRVEYEVADGKQIAGRRAPAALADPAAAVRAALDAPFAYPPLRRALTPDDRVSVVVDEHLPGLAGLLTPLLEHIADAGVPAENVTLVCAPPASRQAWLEELPDAFEEVRLEVHDPADRKRLSYVATMKQGRRLYLNRSVVDADLAVVLSGCRYDPLLGRGGAEGAVYPALGDAETRADWEGRPDLSAPEDAPGPALREAVEAAWLLGAPFFVSVVEGAGDGVAHVTAGAADAAAEGRRLLDAAWRWRAPRAADVVVAGLSGDPSRQTFADLAAAAACAVRVVKAGGRIVLLSQGRPELPPSADALLQSEDAEAARGRLRRKPTVEQVPALRWAEAAAHARLYVLSGLPDDTVEDLFATPMRHAVEAQRLLDAGGDCLFVEDAHKALVLLEG